MQVPASSPGTTQPSSQPRSDTHPRALAIVRRRLGAQRLAADPLDAPGQVVDWLGAMQAQEFAEAKWSIAQRLQGATDADVEAAFADGAILRTHLLRPTWHFVTPGDIRWLLRLTRPRVHAANRYSYKKFELDGALLLRSIEVLAEALADGVASTRPELAEALSHAGIEADGLRLGYILMHAELEELMCSGPRRGKQHTYALLDQRAPVTGDLSPADPLAELALRYFRSRGPATAEDFAYWSGLTLTDARAGAVSVSPNLQHETDTEGGDWLFAPDTPTPGVASGAFLLPMYDEMVMAYKGVKVHLAKAPPREGLLHRPIVIDGRTVGSWKRTLTKRALKIEASVFQDLSVPEIAALEAAAKRFGAFSELPVNLETGLA